MKNKTNSSQTEMSEDNAEEMAGFQNIKYSGIELVNKRQTYKQDNEYKRAEILFVTSYPPRECGIATYSQDLIKALNNKFSNSFTINVCALESGNAGFQYPDEVKYVLKTSIADRYDQQARKINADSCIKIVMIQHEFGFFRAHEQEFLQFLASLKKPIVVVFHTVLPNPGKELLSKIRIIASVCESIIVMTHNSAEILMNEYGLPGAKISVIAHGTHLVPHLDKKVLKKKYGFEGRKILTTFGLLSSGKSIETTLNALPSVISTNPEVLFLIIGKTHPEVLKEEGEKYRHGLELIVNQNNLTRHVKFINAYLALPDLLEYLQLTDIYLFTSSDPNQAVSGTFAYAMSCGCPIISTPIPHAKELLTEDTGIIIDFNNAAQLAEGVRRLLNDTRLRNNIQTNTLQKIVSTAWENSAVKHAMVFEKISGINNPMQYNLPAINLDHLKRMTTSTGIIQFSRINQPDKCSGYTLDDNARALVAMGMYLRLTGEQKSINYIKKYFNFIKLCLQPAGDFLNYVSIDNKFTAQNRSASLDDANGRAVWALGYLTSEQHLLPSEIVFEANAIIKKIHRRLEKIQSPRAMAFIIKGLYYHQTVTKLPENLSLIKVFANRLVQMYRHVSDKEWKWFEEYLTYANSILPEAMLYAWLMTGDKIYKDIARESLDFLLSKTFNENGIEVISSKSWLQKGGKPGHFGEQPIDVGYTIMTLSKFFDVFQDEEYGLKMETAFNWFLGNNRLHQIVYNPCTGGCYDGLEESHVNLNQGAESTLSYLMARLTVEKYKKAYKLPCGNALVHFEMRSKQEKRLVNK